MQLAKQAAVTHHPGEQTIPQLCYCGSELRCSRSSGSAGKESHIPEEGRKPRRGGSQLRLRPWFPAGPRSHTPGAPLWPGPQPGYLAAII